MSAYEVVIGIETHVQLATKTKLFCDCDNNSRDAEPNRNVCPVCLGMPGALPVLNREAVTLALRAGQALHAFEQHTPYVTKFDRKNYFYPDSPKGYQITQLDQPIIPQGYVDIPLEGGQTKRIGVTRAHLEGDAGKLTHPTGADYSLVDLNRADTPLIEIVSEPDLRSAAEAKAYAQELYNLMRYAGVSDADLYYGNMRFDVNVSLRPVGSQELGTRTESKNLNSFRAVAGVVEYETKRQAELLDAGKRVVQETRGWDEDKGVTVSQRSKEEAHDYRYFPEPDLPPIEVSAKMLQTARHAMPKLMPADVRSLLLKHQVDARVAETLVENQLFAQSIMEVAANDPAAIKLVANWLAGEVQAELSGDATLTVPSKVQWLALAQLIHNQTVSASAAKKIVAIMTRGGGEPEQIARAEGLVQESNPEALAEIIDQVLRDHDLAVQQYRSGDTKVFGFLVGQAMKLSRGRANPGMINQALREHLDATK